MEKSFNLLRRLFQNLFHRDIIWPIIEGGGGGEEANSPVNLIFWTYENL